MKIVIFLLLLVVSPAIAQQQEPYEPFSVTEQEYKGLTEYLGNQPLRMAEPIAQWLRQREAQAQQEKRAKAEAKDKEKK